MADADQQRAAFDQIAKLLRDSASANAHALHVHRATAAGSTLERQLEHTLDRLAGLYGHGTFESLSITEILQTAIDAEMQIANELPDPVAATTARLRAGSLIDAARRGVGLNVRGPASVASYRGIYVEPIRPELLSQLHQERQPYVKWRTGILVVQPDDALPQLRAAGYTVDILFLDSDEMLDLHYGGPAPQLDAELNRRLTAARAATDHVGDSREKYLVRRLLHQSTTLRNLRDRLVTAQPGAHQALLPILQDHRAALETALRAAPPPQAVQANALTASIDYERELQQLVNTWAAEPDDPARLHARFKAVADAGTRLPELERHRP